MHGNPNIKYARIFVGYQTFHSIGPLSMYSQQRERKIIWNFSNLLKGAENETWGLSIANECYSLIASLGQGCVWNKYCEI